MNKYNKFCDDYKFDIMKKTCDDCIFIFFTHYESKKICGSCEKIRDIPRYVNKWND